MRQRMKNQLNNKGFSLVEILIAIVILAIVSVPLIRSFATTAATNAKAKVLMLATDCAENMMEMLESRTLEEFMAQYETEALNTETDGTYSLTVSSPDKFPTVLPEGYSIKITADPTLYSNANALNLSDVRSMSVTDTAVYEMAATYDDEVYAVFDEYNRNANAVNKLLHWRVDKEYFKENLTRTIEIVIDKVADGKDKETGERIDIVTVDLNISYYFRSKRLYQDYLPSKNKKYAEETRELYNNKTTNIPLSTVFVFYQPRYLATLKGNSDNIVISNPDNVPVNVMIAAQKGAEDEQIYKQSYFNSGTGPNITIVENSGTASEDAAVTLFTNLCEEIPYSSKAATEDGTVSDGTILCNLVYQDGAVTKKGPDAVEALDVRDLDGKTLLAANMKKRIYKVRVAVLDKNGESVVELDGTKLE